MGIFRNMDRCKYATGRQNRHIRNGSFPLAQPVGPIERFGQAATEQEALRQGLAKREINPMTRRNEDRSATSSRGPNRQADRLVDMNHQPRFTRRHAFHIHAAAKQFFRYAERGHRGGDAQVRGDACPTRVQYARAVDHHDFGQSARRAHFDQQFEQDRYFAEGEITGNVRENDAAANRLAPNKPAGRRLDESVGSQPFLITWICDVDAADQLRNAFARPNDDPLSYRFLLARKPFERAVGLKNAERESFEIDRAVAHVDAFGTQPTSFFRLISGDVTAQNSVRTNDAMARTIRRVFMVKRKMANPSGSDAVAQGIGQVAARCYSTCRHLTNQPPQAFGQIGHGGKTIWHGIAISSRGA